MTTFILCSLLLTFGAAGDAVPDAQIKSDEEIIFFPTLALPAADNNGWELPIHGWIFEREWANAMALRWAAAEGVDRQALTPDAARILTDRAHWFVLDGERGKTIQIRVAGQNATTRPSDADGHFHGSVRLDADAAAKASESRGPCTVIPFRAITSPEDQRTFAGHAVLIGTTGLSIVSDIDDTIKITAVHDPAQMLSNTFFQPMAAVPGMAAHYRARAAADPATAFHYVSASPWQLFVPLQEFLDTNGFPAGSMHLREVQVTYAHARAHFAPPADYKVTRITPLFEKFPKRRFVLIGDAGERDPEAYAELAGKFPTQVVRILIRATPGFAADNPRFKKVFAGLPDALWQVFTTPEEIRD